MRLLSLLLTPVPMCVSTGAALWCLAHGHTGFAVAFTVLAFLTAPDISVETRQSEGGAK